MLHSQSHRAYNSSQWVGEASFKPWRKSSYLPTPPPFLSLTHRHGQGPIREGCSIQYASHIPLQYKQMELHLSNVGKRCNREKPGRKCLVHMYNRDLPHMHASFYKGGLRQNDQVAQAVDCMRFLNLNAITIDFFDSLETRRFRLPAEQWNWSIILSWRHFWMHLFNALCNTPFCTISMYVQLYIENPVKGFCCTQMF